MAKPAYSTDNIHWITLPDSYRFGGENSSSIDSNITMETDSGAVFAYQQFTRHIWELHFRVTLANLAGFRALHDTVSGFLNPFYFGFKTGSYSNPLVAPATVYLVRKEAEFRPVEMDQPLGANPGYEYVLKLQEEIS